MSISSPTPGALRVAIAPESLGFSDRYEPLQRSPPWVGQARELAAARLGLGMEHADYKRIVLGQVGSGQWFCLPQVLQAMAANKFVPPDLC